MKNMPGRNIFYIVSKIDPAKEPALSSDEDTDDEYVEESDESKEHDVMRKVFNKLVTHKFIGVDVDMTKCDRFHALSAWKIKTYRRTEQEGKTPPADLRRYVDNFDHFKQCLLDCAKDQLIEYVEKAAESLRDSHKRCLDFFIDTANRLFQERNQIESQMTHIQAEEGKLFRTVTEMVQTNQSQLAKCINQVRLQFSQ
jgi:hypothetical protein